jgi:hypothetical protein
MFKIVRDDVHVFLNDGTRTPLLACDTHVSSVVHGAVERLHTELIE